MVLFLEAFVTENKTVELPFSQSMPASLVIIAVIAIAIPFVMEFFVSIIRESTSVCLQRDKRPRCPLSKKGRIIRFVGAIYPMASTLSLLVIYMDIVVRSLYIYYSPVPFSINYFGEAVFELVLLLGVLLPAFIYTIATMHRRS